MESEEHRDTEASSKTKRKKEALALQELGEQLTEFSSTQLHQLPLSEQLVTALIDFNLLPNSHGARKRQLQFIGRLMRDCDFDAVTRSISYLQSNHRETDIRHNEANKWCQKIIDGGDSRISEILTIFPQLERQKLRQLCREHNRASETQQQKAKSKLQTYLQQFLN